VIRFQMMPLLTHLFVLLALLSTQSATAQVDPAKAAAAVLRIGLVLPEIADSDDAGARLGEAAADSALMGATMAEEEFAFTARLLGLELDVLSARAADAAAARQSAERLVVEEGALALIGGFGKEQALAVAAVAEEREVPFLNIAASHDGLRNEACSRFTFHVSPSAAMYLDALAGWFVRSGFRDWFFVVADHAEGESRYERVRWALRERHFGAREVGKAKVEPGASTYDSVLEAINAAGPQVVLLLLAPEDQLGFLRQAEAAAIEAEIVGFPDAAAQTRTFFAAAIAAGPRVGAGYRATAWEATLDAYGARELNARFGRRWGRPMDTPAWAAFQAIKIIYEAVSLGGARTGPGIVEYLDSPETVFDIWKGIGVSFRPWDHQLRQSLYLVHLDARAEDPLELATLVGELPAIYLPRTDPVERLDQLGDLRRRSGCLL
jgi:ABC-type branched-subunit amino acid transport system substrate-binding protein